MVQDTSIVSSGNQLMVQQTSNKKIIPVSSAKFKESNHLPSPSSVNLQAHQLVVIWGYIFLVHADFPKQVYLPSGTGTQRSVPQLIGPWLNSNPNWASLILSPRELELRMPFSYL